MCWVAPAPFCIQVGALLLVLGPLSLDWLSLIIVHLSSSCVVDQHAIMCILYHLDMWHSRWPLHPSPKSQATLVPSEICPDCHPAVPASSGCALDPGLNCGPVGGSQSSNPCLCFLPSWEPRDLRQQDLSAECVLSLRATLRPPRGVPRPGPCEHPRLTSQESARCHGVLAPKSRL